MNKNKKRFILILSIIIISIIILLATIFIINITKDKKITEQNMQIIKDNYNELTATVSEYNQIRTDLSNLLNDFVYEEYPTKHEEYTNLLTKYNNNIKNIDKNILNIHDRCNVIYNDISINKICDSYQELYEKLVNLYVTDLTNYNNKITSYNEYKKEDKYQVFELIHKEYIDYNEDKKYEGQDANNE